MPRPKYVRFDKIAPAHLRALELFLEHGITGVRMNNHGQIAWIKHSLFGWVSPQVFLLIQKLEKLPWDKVIEGGYRLNAEIFGAEVSVEVLASGAKVPLGQILVGLTGTTLLIAVANNEWTAVALLLAGLLLPFGSLLLIWFFTDALIKLLGQAGQAWSSILAGSEGALKSIITSIVAPMSGGGPLPPGVESGFQDFRNAALSPA